MADPREALAETVHFALGRDGFDVADDESRAVADAILAEFDVTPPGERVKPSEEDVARALDALDARCATDLFEWSQDTNPETARTPPVAISNEVRARAVLALFPGRTESEVKAEAWKAGMVAGRNRWMRDDDNEEYPPVNPYRKDETT